MEIKKETVYQIRIDEQEADSLSTILSFFINEGTGFVKLDEIKAFAGNLLNEL